MNKYLMSILAITCLSLVLIAEEPKKEATTTESDLIVHEWGLIDNVQGTQSNIITGIPPNDDFELPDFLQTKFKSAEENSLPISPPHGEPSKPRAPVLYFYSEVPCVVSIRVSIQSGIPLNCYPWTCQTPLFQTDRIQKDKSDRRKPAKMKQDGLYWEIELNRPSEQTEKLFKKVKPDSFWGYLRETDALTVYAKNSSAGESAEKFIYYEAQTTMEPPMVIKTEKSKEHKGNDLKLANKLDDELKHIYVIYNGVESSYINYIPKLTAHQELSLNPAEQPTKKPGVEELRKQLIAAGLYEKEANGFIKTWEKALFNKSGLRVFYLLPETLVNKSLPLEIKGIDSSAGKYTVKLKEVKRIMLYKTECLTPEFEKTVSGLLAKLGDDDFNVREAAQKQLEKIGCVALPLIREKIKETDDPEIKNRCKNILYNLESKPNTPK